MAKKDPRPPKRRGSIAEAADASGWVPPEGSEATRKSMGSRILDTYVGLSGRAIRAMRDHRYDNRDNEIVEDYGARAGSNAIEEAAEEYARRRRRR